MNFDRRIFRRTQIFLTVLAILAVILRLFTYWVEIDQETGFFRGSEIACTIYNGIGFFVFALCLLLSMKKGGDPILFPTEEKAESTETTVELDEIFSDDESVAEDKNAVRLPDFSEKTAVWSGTRSALYSFLPGFGFLAYSLSFFTQSGLAGDPYRLIFAILSALSGASFIFIALTNSPYAGKLRPFLALIPCFWCTVRLVVDYRDLARFVNKSLYVGQFLFIISALVFFLYQAQLLFGEKPLTRPNAYAFSALAVLFFGVTCRMAQLVAVFGDKMMVDLVDASSLFIDLALTLFVSMKIRKILL